MFFLRLCYMISSREKMLILDVVEIKYPAAWSATNESLPVYASPLILQIYSIFATASKCRENNRHSAQWWLDFWCGLRTIGSKFKFPHLTQTETLIHYNYRSFLCESRVVYFWKFRSHSGQYTVRLINTCNIHSQVWQESKRYFTNSWDQDYSYFSFFRKGGILNFTYIYLPLADVDILRSELKKDQRSVPWWGYF